MKPNLGGRTALVTGGTDGIGKKVLVGLVADPLLGQTPEQIAGPAMRLLVSPEFEGKSGLLFTQIKRFRAAEPGTRTLDPREGARFWEFSERLAVGARTRGRAAAEGDRWRPSNCVPGACFDASPPPV